MNHRSYYLEILPEDFAPKSFDSVEFEIVVATVEQLERCRCLWTEVGKGFWNDRHDWDQAKWESHLEDENTCFYIARKESNDIGFFELTRIGCEFTIEGFGLLEEWRGMGIGGWLLTSATELGFKSGASRIRLHTATDDHPNALPNYLKRGYQIYRDEPLENPMCQPVAGGDATR